MYKVSAESRVESAASCCFGVVAGCARQPLWNISSSKQSGPRESWVPDRHHERRLRLVDKKHPPGLLFFSASAKHTAKTDGHSYYTTFANTARALGAEGYGYSHGVCPNPCEEHWSKKIKTSRLRKAFHTCGWRACTLTYFGRLSVPMLMSTYHLVAPCERTSSRFSKSTLESLSI